MRAPNAFEEEPNRRPNHFRLIQKMCEDFSFGHFAVVFGDDPLPLFADIAAYHSVVTKASVGVVCLDSTPESVMVEMIGCVSGIPREDIKRREIAPHHFSTFNTACSRLYRADLMFAEGNGVDLPTLQALIRRLITDYRVGLIMIHSMNSISLVTDSLDKPTPLHICQRLCLIPELTQVCLAATCVKGEREYDELQADEVIHSEGYLG